MAERRLLFVLSVGGCGTHMVQEFLAAAGCQPVDTSLIEFWPTYVLACKHPDAPSIAKWFQGLSAIEALSGFYRRIEGTEPANPTDLEIARRCFARGLDAMGGTRLIAWHNYELTTSILTNTRDGRTPIWYRSLRDRARNLFESAVIASGYGLKRIALVRNPFSLFFSMRERFISDYSDAERLQIVQEFFEIVEDYRCRIDPSLAIVRYEALCRHDPIARKQLLECIGMEKLDRLQSGAFHSGEIEKYFGYPRATMRSLSVHFARACAIGGYEVGIPGPAEFLMGRIRYAVEKRRSEIDALNRVFSGRSTTSAALFRHRWSRTARIYWQFAMLVPRHRKAFEEFCRVHLPGAAPPRPRLERMLAGIKSQFGRT